MVKVVKELSFYRSTTITISLHVSLLKAGIKMHKTGRTIYARRTEKPIESALQCGICYISTNYKCEV